jgi:tRNA (adenine22-N1)-methyltransferase
MKRLILQPQQDIPRVRRFLHSIGFKIDDEKFIKEDDKYYTIIIASLGCESYECDYDYVYGKILINKKTELFKEYMLNKKRKLTHIYKNISKIDSEYAHQRIKELEEEYKMHEEVIQCIF